MRGTGVDPATPQTRRSESNRHGRMCVRGVTTECFRIQAHPDCQSHVLTRDISDPFTRPARWDTREDRQSLER
jgi:hypothetical protein